MRRMNVVVLLLALAAATVARAQGRTPLWIYPSPDDVLFPPTVGGDGTVYFSSADSQLRAVSSQGRLLWAVNPGGLPSAGIALQNQTLYFPTSKGELCAYSVAGNLAWRVALHSDIRAVPAVASDGTIYVGTVAGELVAISPGGAILWRVDLGDPVLTGVVIDHQGRLYVASTGFLFRFRPSGVQEWLLPLASPVSGRLAVDAQDDVLFLGQDKEIRGVTTQGADLWLPVAATGTTFGAPVVSADMLYLPSSTVTTSTSSSSVLEETTTGQIAAYRLSTGIQAWSQGFGSAAACVLVGGGSGSYVYAAGVADMAVYALDQTTGQANTNRTLRLSQIPKDLVAADTTAGSRLVFVCGSRNLYCYALDMGPDPDAPWPAAGAGPRNLNRRDDAPSEPSFIAPADATVAGAVPVEVAVDDDFPESVTVRFSVDGTPIGSVTGPPYALTWYTATFANGGYTLTAEARDTAGHRSEASMTVTVQNEAGPMEVFVDAPPLSFAWAGAGDSLYKVEFALNDGFDPILADSKSPGHPWVKGTSWRPDASTWKKILRAAAGSTADTGVYWRVVGESAGVVASGVLRIKGPRPCDDLRPIDGSDVGAAPPGLSWNGEHNQKYDAQFSDTADFARILLSSKEKAGWLGKAAWTPGKKAWKKIPAGSRVYWRVVAQDALGRGTTSAVQSLVKVP
jgi:outer membrane protein assembly factor BamB